MPQGTVYDRKYSQGGWDYDRATEEARLQRMVDAAGLTPPASIIEIACGQGFHTGLLSEMGFRVVGNDYSEVGISNARKAYPHIEFHWGDSRDLPDKLGRERFDGLLVRGHSHHHYELPLQGLSRKQVDVAQSTQAMFDLVKPGGAVMVFVRTDFSGGTTEAGVINNELAAYLDFFGRFGRIVSVTDRDGTAIEDDRHARQLGKKPNNGIIVVTLK